MVMPNIGAFIAWASRTSPFIPTGWLPNETLAAGRPHDHLPAALLIGYTGGKLIGGDRVPWSVPSPPWASSWGPTSPCSWAP